MIIYSEILLKILTGNRAVGMALFPFILIKKRHITKEVITHEKIHLRQQLELLILPFYLLYIIEFLILYIQTKNLNLAYRKISFEKEAYANQNNTNYLSKRRFYAWIKYYSI